jgi:hypothetical protein
MIRRSLLLVIFTVFALLVTGCSPPWTIVQQTTPNPFVGQHKFAVAPTDYSALRVGNKSEAEYLAGKDEKQQQSFQTDKLGANEAFTAELINRAREAGVDIVLATGPADAPFVILPSVTFFEPGFYAGVVASPSRLDVNFKITTADGKVLDEILMTHLSQAPTMNQGLISALSNIDKMSSGGRIRADAAWIGKTGSKYIMTRVSP